MMRSGSTAVSALADRAKIGDRAGGNVDCFGSLPPEVENLLDIIAIRHACREAGIEKLETGQGRGHALRDDRFANPAGLVDLIQRNAVTLKLRRDQKLVCRRKGDSKARFCGIAKLAQALA
jgi:transcription-repair coupling factor (superfamily II helicase)